VDLTPSWEKGFAGAGFGVEEGVSSAGDLPLPSFVVAAVEVSASFSGFGEPSSGFGDLFDDPSLASRRSRISFIFLESGASGAWLFSLGSMMASRRDGWEAGDVLCGVAYEV